MQRFILGLGILGTLLGGAPASAQLSSQLPGPLPIPLDVPYLPQSELLCGGAALAMVERYWGRRGVYAEEFGSLVRRDEGGIRTEDLARAARERDWETAAFDGTPEQLRYLLSKQIPVIALIEVGPRRYHYVVLLEWADGKVRYHDPARAPNRQIDEEEFQQEWAGGARWAMTIRPPANAPESTPPPDGASSAPMPCPPWIDQGLDAAAAGNLDSAVVLLSAAQRACPEEPLVLRELAGVRFRQQRYDQSAILSEAYVDRVPTDTLGWNILATSEYLTGDPRAAMQAWQHIGGLEVDLVRIDGLRRVRYRVAEEAVGIRHSTQLDERDLVMARRRVNDVPAFYRGRVDYLPVAGGRTEVRVAVGERPLIEPWIPLAAGNGLSAVAREEVALELGSILGAGERWNGSWRWEHAHPRTSVELAVPSRLGWTGVVTVGGSWERFRYGIDSLTVQETRRSGGIGFGAWVIPELRPSLGLRYDRWSGERRYVVVSQANELRLARDRFTLRTTLEAGIANEAAASYTAGSLRARWASSPLLQHTSWSIRYGVDLADSHTPAGLWPFASGDVPGAIPLRAHPFTLRDLLPSSTIARSVMHGGVAVDQPFYRSPLITLALGGFVDWAMMSDRLNGRPTRTFVDGGGGLRIGLADGALGVIRIDLATGLNDDHSALTVGMHREWPL
jgi:hypothetical protein